MRDRMETKINYTVCYLSHGIRRYVTRLALNPIAAMAWVIANSEDGIEILAVKS